MPKALEQALMRRAKAKGLSEKRKNAYVYGTMRKTGWEPTKKSPLEKAIHSRANKMAKKTK